jgi:RNA polymerase sigma-70 factor (ECF subfamily)
MPDRREITDEELVIEVRSKDKERYIDVVKRYEEKLMRYVTYLIGDEEKAKDVVQDSFIKAYVNLNGFDTKKKFSSWIYRIVHNEAINSVKKYHKEVPLKQDMDFESGEDIEHDFTKKEIIEKAHICLQEMPMMYSEPLSLFFLEDMPYDQISDILRLPMGTIATRINRAKTLMKTICQKKS